MDFSTWYTLPTNSLAETHPKDTFFVLSFTKKFDAQLNVLLLITVINIVNIFFCQLPYILVLAIIIARIFFSFSFIVDLRICICVLTNC